MSEIKVDKISPESGTAFTIGDSGDTFTVPSGATIVNSGTATGFGGGKIGQVVSAIGTARITTTSLTEVTTGIAVTITPVATSSKIWLTANIGSFSSSEYGARAFFTIVGGNAATYKGDAATGHEVSSCAVVDRANYGQISSQINYLDSPSTTSATTYTLYYWGSEATTIFNAAGILDAAGGNAASSITAMEVLA